MRTRLPPSSYQYCKGRDVVTSLTFFLYLISFTSYLRTIQSLLDFNHLSCRAADGHIQSLAQVSTIFPDMGGPRLPINHNHIVPHGFPSIITKCPYQLPLSLQNTIKEAGALSSILHMTKKAYLEGHLALSSHLISTLHA